MNTKNNRFFMILNIVIPILAGAVIYYLTSPDVIFVQYVDALFGRTDRMVRISSENWSAADGLLRYARYYLLDMLWAYALVFLLQFIYGNGTASLRKCFWTAFIFSTFMEIIQIFSMVPGTFDWVDILVELLAELIAVFIIKGNISKTSNSKQQSCLDS